MKIFGHRHDHDDGTRSREEATAARQAAEADLEATRRETPLYRALGDSLRDLRERNHFGDKIAAIYRGDHR